jgi:D-alanyl-lipoteichoic acid acyltransferase DltB (MBOAT superfamily)
MLFNSLPFLVFAALFFPVYFALRGNVRLLFTLLASYFFYAWWDYRFVGLLVLSSYLGFVLGVRIEMAEGNQRLRRRYLLVSVFFNLGLLSMFKYLNFFVDSAWSFVSLFTHVEARPALKIILPVGISFFTFQNLSYVIDVYRGTIPKAERTFLHFASYSALFPHLVAGPIVRASHILPQLKHDHPLDWSRIARGLELCVWGYFLKVGLADTAATVVGPRFGTPDLYGALSHIIGVLCFAVQIYGDFCGYSLIAIGFGRVMGFDFGINFNRPYFSSNFSEFWTRWHISLSAWLRDYVYISLGGNRRGTLATYRNLMLTMLLGGLWHGAGVNFIIWGGLHGSYLVVQRLASPAYDAALKALRVPRAVSKLLAILTVFLLTCFAWIFFRADKLETAWHIVSIIAAHKDMKLHMAEQTIGIAKVALLASVVLAVDLLSLVPRVREAYMSRPVLRASGALLLIWAVILFGTFEGASFLYFQF